jgi:hypothetical protein
MKARKRHKAIFPHLMMTNLALASWETMMRRTLLMAQNACSPTEYQRMVREKTEAAMESGLKLMLSGGQASLSSLLVPWHSRATANAKRLRKK